MGTIAVIFPWVAPWMLTFLAVGFVLGDSAPWALASLILLPLFSHFMDGPSIILAATVAMLIITIIKQVEANRRPLPEDPAERRKVLFLRVFFDRDIPDHHEWINRKL